MSEIDALLQKAHRYMRSATVLLEDGDSDSAVSRIYYAMFYCAEAVLLTKSLTYSSHKGVLSAFGEHFVKTDIFPREMGRNLNKAFEKRQLGDYECASTFDQDEAQELLDNGQIFVDSITNWLKHN